MKTLVLLLFFTGLTNPIWSNDTVLVFDSTEKSKIEYMINHISSDSISIFEKKYSEWIESTNRPEILIHSNPEMYKTEEFYEFKEFTLSLGDFYIGLLIDFFEEHSNGVYYYLLLDITYDDYGYLIDSVRDELGSLNLDATTWHNNFPTCYFKKILSTIKVPGIPDTVSRVNNSKVNTLLLNFYPNPIQNLFILEFELKEAECISVRLLNDKGQLVDIIRDNVVYTAGKHSMEWYRKSNIISGYYLLSINSDNFKINKKLLLE